MSASEIQEQDDLIGSLQDGVGKLRERAHLIHEESHLHMRLLENIDADVDGTTVGLMQETKYAEQIRKQGGVFYYYVAIMALTGLMIFLLVIGTS